jgi:hypothetical protein
MERALVRLCASPCERTSFPTRAAIAVAASRIPVRSASGQSWHPRKVRRRAAHPLCCTLFPSSLPSSRSFNVIFLRVVSAHVHIIYGVCARECLCVEGGDSPGKAKSCAAGGRSGRQERYLVPASEALPPPPVSIRRTRLPRRQPKAYNLKPNTRALNPKPVFSIRRTRIAATSTGHSQVIGVEQLLEFERKGHIKTDAVLRSLAEADAIHSAVTGEYLRRRKEAYVQKTRLFAMEDEDEELYQRYKF